MSNFFRLFSGVQLILKTQLKYLQKPKVYPKYQGKIYRNEFKNEEEEILTEIKFETKKSKEETEMKKEYEESKIQVEENFINQEHVIEKNSEKAENFEVEKKEKNFEETEKEENFEKIQIEQKVPSNSISRLLNFSR